MTDGTSSFWCPSIAVAGLTRPLQISDLHTATQVFNEVACEGHQPTIRTHNGIIEQLGNVFHKHGAHRMFGIALLQRHIQLKHGIIIVGEYMTKQGGLLWNRTTEVAAVDAALLRGQNFKVNARGTLVPYTLAYGRLPEMTIDPDFFQEFADLVVSTTNSEVLGLQVLTGIPSTSIEFDLGLVGTVLVSLRSTDRVPSVMGDLDFWQRANGWILRADRSGKWSFEADSFSAASRIRLDEKEAWDQGTLIHKLRTKGIVA